MGWDAIDHMLAVIPEGDLDELFDDGPKLRSGKYAAQAAILHAMLMAKAKANGGTLTLNQIKEVARTWAAAFTRHLVTQALQNFRDGGATTASALKAAILADVKSRFVSVEDMDRVNRLTSDAFLKSMSDLVDQKIAAAVADGIVRGYTLGGVR